VPGVDPAKFQELVEATRTGCPISKLLKPGAEIVVKATLK
jgi:osmotically inducible protein OsmC